jgi:general secretion pathway protein N
MKRVWIGMLSLLVFLVAIVIQAPATLLDVALSSATDGRLRMGDTRGSLWSGSGVVLVDAAGARSALPLGALNWKFSDFSDGAPQIRLSFDNRPMGAVKVNTSGVSATLADLRVPASETLSLLPGALGRAELDGQLTLKSASGDCDWLARCVGKAELAWFGASTRRIENGELGEYFLSLDARDNRLDFTLSSGEGSIALEGKGHFSNSTGLSFNGAARGDDALLSQFPGFLGPIFQATDKPGEYKITIDGQFIAQ